MLFSCIVMENGKCCSFKGVLWKAADDEHNDGDEVDDDEHNGDDEVHDEHNDDD